MTCEDYDPQIAPFCDRCGDSDVDLIECPQCEYRYCNECHTNYVTDAGCPACIPNASREERRAA